jgi:glycosyltransferase involved in cell wall biosynthesis
MTESVGPVLLVDLALGFGGAESRVIDTAIGLSPHVTCSVAVLEGTPMAARARAAGLDVMPMRLRRSDPRLLGALRRVIRDGGYRVVDAHNAQSQWWGHLAGRAERVPALVSTVHSEYRLENPGPKGWVHEQVLRRNATWGCRFIAVSGRIETYLRGLAGPDTRVDLIRRGFPLPVPEAARTIPRSALGWHDDDPVVGVIGRLAPAKGHAVLLDAVASLKQRGRMVRCYIVGDGALLRELETQVSDLRLEDVVEIAGFTNDVGSVLDLVDIVCIPSLTEGLPNVMLEAAGAKLPLVVTEVGEIPILLRSGVDAVLVPPGDSEALASAIEQVCALPDRGQSLAESAYRILARKLGGDWLGATLEAYTGL